MGLFVAIGFLTTIPSPLRRQITADDLKGSVGYFPLVGLLLGLGLAGLDALLGLVFPAVVQNALLIMALVLLTGGMHLDGLIDTCDGIFHRSNPERRLEIMRDSRVGAYGVIGAVSVLLLKYAVLVALPTPLRLGGFVTMAMASRLAMACCLVAFPYARPEPGLGRLFQGEAGRKDLILGALLVAVVTWVFLGYRGLMALGATGLATFGLARYISGKINGLTGDTYGAINEVTEVILLLLLLLSLKIGL